MVVYSSFGALSAAKPLITRALQKHSHTPPPIDWLHIIAPHIYNNRIRGYHYRGLSWVDVPTLTAILRERDEQGFYSAQFSYQGLEKISSFFPDTWTLEELYENLCESYASASRLLDTETGFIGYTRHQVPIRFWCKETVNGAFWIASAYPLLNLP